MNLACGAVCTIKLAKRSKCHNCLPILLSLSGQLSRITYCITRLTTARFSDMKLKKKHSYRKIKVECFDRTGNFFKTHTETIGNKYAVPQPTSISE